MRKTVRAVIRPYGTVRLLEPIHLERARNALVAILDGPLDGRKSNWGLADEAALSD